MPSFISTEIVNLEELITPIKLTGDEGLDLPFSFQLFFLCQNQRLNLNCLITKPITAWIHHPNTQSQVFNGVITAATSGVINAEGSRCYKVQFESCFSLLIHARDYRVFINKNVIDITKEIFKQYNITNYDLKCLTQNYTEHAQITQYNESPYHFLQRIWHGEGIYYYFTHYDDYHTLHLANHGQPLSRYPQEMMVNFNHEQRHHIASWQHHKQMNTTQITAHTYDYMSPNNISKASASNINPPFFANSEKHESYLFGHDLPKIPHYLETKIKRKLARINLNNDYINAKSTYPNLSPGVQLNITQHPFDDEIGDYWVARIHHHAQNKFNRNDYTHAEYSNKLILHTIQYDYVPSQTLSKPKMPSLDTAIITGPPNKEIYVDDMARFKCQFHWDQHGPLNENSSSLVRATQPWSGQHYGTQWLPRIGHTAIIGYLYGDPDYPIITGTLPHQKKPPAFKLPQNKTQTGFRSHSFNNKNSLAGNILQFDDNKNSAAVNIKAQKDFNIQSTGNSRKIIQGDSSNITQRGNWEVNINNTYSLTANHCIYLTCGDSIIKIEYNAITFQANQLAFGS